MSFEDDSSRKYLGVEDVRKTADNTWECTLFVANDRGTVTIEVKKSKNGKYSAKKVRGGYLSKSDLQAAKNNAISEVRRQHD